MIKILMYFLFIVCFIQELCFANKKIVFGTSADYPPFEFKKNGELVGFDIDLAKLVAKELKKDAEFRDMQFSTILASLDAGYIDAAIATIAVNDKRKKNFDFSDYYYYVTLSVVFNKDNPIETKQDIANKTIACQLGTSTEMWLKENMPNSKLILFDNNNQVIEALKAGHVEVAVMDGAQAYIFSKNNEQLSYVTIVRSNEGYAIATKKNSVLSKQINEAITILDDKGEIGKLQQKWLGNISDYRY